MALPQKLKLFDLIFDGVGHAGQVEEIMLPMLNMITDQHRSGSMIGMIDIESGVELTDMEFTVSAYLADIIKKMGVMGDRTLTAIAKGAVRENEKVVAVKSTARGFLKQGTGPAWSAGATVSNGYTLSVDYAMLEIDGEVIFECDKIAPKLIVNGVDQLAAERKAVGL